MRRRSALDALVAAAVAGRVVGVEREYTVRGPDGPVDGRTIWPQLQDLGAALDPGDPQARRIPSGDVVTLDGRHVEIATCPVPLTRGCTTELLVRAAAAARHLTDRLPPGLVLEGYSTHLNIEVDDRRVVRTARTLAHRFALAPMLFVDRVGSPGLLVRPRPGRLELGGEFLAGEQLRAAIVMAAGVALLAERRIVGRRRPRVAAPEVANAVERFGWFIDRTAWGGDLYRFGRSTSIGGEHAGRALERIWTGCRPRIDKLFDAAELVLVDRRVSGAEPLPCEVAVDDDGTAAQIPVLRHYRQRTAGSVSVSVLCATWWRAVLELTTPHGTRWLTVPGRALDPLLDAIDRGELLGDLASLVHRR